MKNKLLSILLHPIFIAVVISLVIIYFLPDYFTKYKIELVNQELFNRDHRVYFEDLNNDNISEEIICYQNSLGNAGFEIHSPNGELIDQWNFPNKHSNFNNLWFYDVNNNGFKEIYLITQKRDSLFLNIEEPFVENGIHKKNILIEIINEHNNKFKIDSQIFGAFDINSDGENEIFMTLKRGFSGNPRGVYKYNLIENKIYKSPHLTNLSSISQIIDLNNDGSKEILLRNYAACNKIDSSYTKRSDHSLWFSVLGENLKFLFDPIEFRIPFSSIRTIPLKKDNGEHQLLCLLKSKQEKISLNKLLIYSNTGKLINEKLLPFGDYNILGSNKDEFMLINKPIGQIITYNFDFEELNSVFVKPKSEIYPLDIDKNGISEWLEKSQDQNKITIYQNNFKDPIEFQIPSNDDGDLRHGLKQIGKKEYEIYFQRGNYHFVYQYGENPLYIFRYLIYLGIFLLIFSLVWISRKGQQIQTKKQRAIENQISELQIKTIKNQVDPHFVFNAVNTISEMMLTDDKMEADRFISKFSKLMRETLQKSDKISTTLQEEMDYVENYIQLQQIRFSNSFDYKIKKDIHIDYQTLVPKHVLYSYVENAIKHGLSDMSKNGMLLISANQKNKNILLIIEDNGGGIDKSKNNKQNSTGNGVKIMEEMFTLYEKLYKKKVTHKMVELFDKDNHKVGIRVEIIISK